MMHWGCSALVCVWPRLWVFREVTGEAGSCYFGFRVYVLIICPSHSGLCLGLGFAWFFACSTGLSDSPVSVLGFRFCFFDLVYLSVCMCLRVCHLINWFGTSVCLAGRLSGHLSVYASRSAAVLLCLYVYPSV